MSNAAVTKQTRKPTTRRALALIALRCAGYDGDRSAWTRLTVASRVSLTVAQHAWTAGRRTRAAADSSLRKTDSATYKLTAPGGVPVT